MTGVEVAAGLAALGSTAGTGAAAAGTGAALGAGAAGAAGTGAALGAGAAGAAGAGAALGAGAGTAAGLTAAEAAALGIAPETMGLLAAETGVNAAGAIAPEMAASEGLLGGSEVLTQAPAEVVDMSSQAGLLDKMNYQSNGMIGQAQDWLGQKPMGEGKLSPSRGQMIQKGASAATPEQQQSAPPARKPGGQYQPVAQSSPYMNGTQTPEQFLAMADFLKRRY